MRVWGPVIDASDGVTSQGKEYRKRREPRR